MAILGKHFRECEFNHFELRTGDAVGGPTRGTPRQKGPIYPGLGKKDTNFKIVTTCPTKAQVKTQHEKGKTILHWSSADKTLTLHFVKDGETDFRYISVIDLSRYKVTTVVGAQRYLGSPDRKNQFGGNVKDPRVHFVMIGTGPKAHVRPIVLGDKAYAGKPLLGGKQIQKNFREAYDKCVQGGKSRSRVCRPQFGTKARQAAATYALSRRAPVSRTYRLIQRYKNSISFPHNHRVEIKGSLPARYYVKLPNNDSDKLTLYYKHNGRTHAIPVNDLRTHRKGLAGYWGSNHYAQVKISAGHARVRLQRIDGQLNADHVDPAKSTELRILARQVTPTRQPAKIKMVTDVRKPIKIDRWGTTVGINLKHLSQTGARIIRHVLVQKGNRFYRVPIPLTALSRGSSNDNRNIVTIRLNNPATGTNQYRMISYKGGAGTGNIASMSPPDYRPPLTGSSGPLRNAAGYRTKPPVFNASPSAPNQTSFITPTNLANIKSAIAAKARGEDVTVPFPIFRVQIGKGRSAVSRWVTFNNQTGGLKKRLLGFNWKGSPPVFRVQFRPGIGRVPHRIKISISRGNMLQAASGGTLYNFTTRTRGQYYAADLRQRDTDIDQDYFPSITPEN